MKLKYDALLSNVAYNCNVRPFMLVESGVDVDGGMSSGALLGEFANMKVG